MNADRAHYAWWQWLAALARRDDRTRSVAVPAASKATGSQKQ